MLLYLVKTFDFQISSYILDDGIMSFPFKSFNLFNTLITLSSFSLVVGILVFLVNNRSFFLYLIGVELLLLGAIINFITYLYFLEWFESEIYTYYILTVAVAESAFGLGLLIHSFNIKKSINPLIFNDLS